MGESRRHFRIEQSGHTAGTVRLALFGDLDLASASELTERLRQLARSGRSVQLDLSHVTFIDSSGIRAVIFSVSAARRDGWELEVGREVPEPVRRVIELVGVGAHIWPHK